MKKKTWLAPLLVLSSFYLGALEGPSAATLTNNTTTTTTGGQTTTQLQNSTTTSQNLINSQNNLLALAATTPLSTAAQSLSLELSASSAIYGDMNYLYGTTLNGSGTQSEFDRVTLNAIVAQNGYVESTFISHMQRSTGLLQGLRTNTTARTSFNREYTATLSSSGTPNDANRADLLAVVIKPYYNESNLLNLIITQPTATAAYWELAMYLQGSSIGRTDFNFLYGGTIGTSGSISTADRNTLNSIISQSGYAQGSYITYMQRSADLLLALRANTTARTAFNREYSATIGTSGTPTSAHRAQLDAAVTTAFYNETNLMGLMTSWSTATAAHWELAMALQGWPSYRTDFNLLYAGTVPASGTLSTSDRAAISTLVQQAGWVQGTYFTRQDRAASLYRVLQGSSTYRSSFNALFGATVQSTGSPNTANRAILFSAVNPSNYDEEAFLALLAPSNTPPTAPANLTGSVSGTTVNLSWTASTDNLAVTGYQVFQNGVLRTTTTSTSYAATGLTSGQTYSFYVRAFDASNSFSPASNTITRTPLSGPDTTDPSVPGGVTYSFSGTQLVLDWTASTDNAGVTGYEIYNSFTEVGTSTTTTFTSAALAAGGNYTFRIRAYDAAGNYSAYATTGSFTVPTPSSNTPPTAPANLTGSVSGTTVNLSWTASTDNLAVTGYQVFQNGVLRGTTTSTSYAATGLTTGQTYAFSVRAFDAANSFSPSSNTVTFTLISGPDTTVPSVPDGVTYSFAGTQLVLSWTPSTDNAGVAGYEIYRSYTPVGTATGTTFTTSALTVGSSYTFRIRAYDAAGNYSAYATTGNFVVPAPTTPPPTTTPPPALPGQIFSPTSFWNTKIPSTRPVASNSATLVTELVRNTTLGGGPWMNSLTYSTPYFVANASTPKKPVYITHNGVAKTGTLLYQQMILGVPIPTNVQAAAGTDGHVTIYDASTDTLYEYWKFRYVNGRYEASWGGILKNASTATPTMPTPTNQWGVKEYWGATATGLPVIGGTIMLKELQAGVIPHALAFSIPQGGRTFKWPATRSDGPNTASNAIPAGTVFRLPANTYIDPTWSPLTRMIVTAVRDYGMILRDTAGAFAFYAEDTTPYLSGNPYNAFLDGDPLYESMRDFPFSSLQALA